MVADADVSMVESRDTIRDERRLLMELCLLRLRSGLFAGMGGEGREDEGVDRVKGGTGGSILSPGDRLCRGDKEGFGSG